MQHRRRAEQTVKEHAGFSKPPWLSMCHYFNQPRKLDDDPAGTSFISMYNIGRILKEGIGDRRKVKFLAVLVLRMAALENGAYATLADPQV